MTRQDLEKHLKMRRQLMECRDILQNLKRSVGSPAHRLLPVCLMRRGSRIRSGDLATEITYMERRVAALQAKVDDQAVEVRNFIAGVQDDQMKIILSLRYIRGLTWIEVALVLGGRNTGSGVRSAVWRFFSDETQRTAEIETR